MKKTLLYLFSATAFALSGTFSINAQTYLRADAQTNNNPTFGTVRVENSSGAIDTGLDGRGDLTTFSTIKASPGIALGGGAYSGHQELIFPTGVTPGADQTTYIRLDTQDGLFKALLGGALGDLLGGIVGGVVLGEQQVNIQARNGSTVVLEGDTSDSNDFASENLRIVADADNNYYAAVTPSAAYDRVRIKNSTFAAIGLGNTKEVDVYGAYYSTNINDCGQGQYTSFSGDGGLLSVLNSSNGVLNAGNVIDSDPDSHSTIKLPTLGVAASAQQTVYFDGISSNTDTFTLTLASPSDVVSLDLLDNVIIEAYDGTTLVDTESLSNLVSLDLLGLFNSNEKVNVVYSPNAQVNRIRVKVQNLVNLSLTSELRWYSILKNQPTPITDDATDITSVSATLNAELSDFYNCLSSTYGFEYSTDPNFAPGSTTYIASTTVDSDGFSAPFLNLIPETVYYYRAVIDTDIDGNDFSYYGAIESFTSNYITWTGSAWDNVDGPTIDDNTLIDGNYNTATNGAISVKDLHISDGNIIIVDNANPLTLFGDVIAENTGSIYAAQGHINYTACETQIINGNDFANNTIANVTANLCVGSALTINNQVKIADEFIIEQGDLNLDNDSNLYFLSDADKTARFGEVDCANTTITYTGTGSVTAERFVPAGSTSGGTQVRRGYRFLSSAIDTEGYGSINDNWQEGEQLVDAYSMNSQSPGYGAFITGYNNANTSPVSDSKLDYNATGLSSMYEYDNANDTWEVVTNTNDPLVAGKGYYILIRGDRTIDMSINAPLPKDTRMRATGKLRTCDQTYSSGTDLADLDEEFSFIGNPYQSSIDVQTILNSATNINNVYYWYLDPNIGTEGGYVTVDVTNGNGATTPSSNGNKYLQAGQAMFVQNIADNPSLSIEESHKVDDDNLGVFRPNTNNYELNLNLLNLNGLVLDGSKLRFDISYSNTVDVYDASKFFNTTENLSLLNNGKNLSIERRNIPEHLETIPLQLSNLNEELYQFQIHWTTIPNRDAYLMDTLLNTEQLLAEGNNTYTFSEEASENRFKIQFRESTLNASNFDPALLTVYPNPAINGDFKISIPNYNQETVTVTLYNTLGQQVYHKEHNVSNNQINVNSNLQSAGVYTLKITSKEVSITKKIINR